VSKLPSFVSDTTRTQLIPFQIPISAVRLVHPVANPETGAVRDVIIKQLARSRVVWDRATGFRSWSRYVPGMNVTIPWPERTKPTFEAQPDDTLRMEVEEQTFIPTLLNPPMPETVIDELRNKYSKFRIRHEEWYVQKKEAEQQEKILHRKTIEEMKTPLQEFNRQRREIRRAQGQPGLSDEMLEKIGQVIAKNKRASLDAAGITAVPSPTA
jgi:large subunit ribosomal protein L24